MRSMFGKAKEWICIAPTVFAASASTFIPEHSRVLSHRDNEGNEVEFGYDEMGRLSFSLKQENNKF